MNSYPRFQGLFITAIVFCSIVGTAHGTDAITRTEAVTTAQGLDEFVVQRARGDRMTCYLRPGTGPTLVLVPGTWGGVWRFETLIENLPKTMSVAVVELCWQSGKQPTTVELSIEQLADDVLRAIELLKCGPFVIAGHSIGGMIAVEIAGRPLPGLVGAIPMEGWTHHTVVKTAFDGIVVNNLTADETAWGVADRERGLGHLSEETRSAIGSIWKGWNGYGALERSTVPVLEIWGDRGKPHPDRKALQVPEQANIQVAWIKEASHRVLLEEPVAVARLVTEFMEALP